MIDSRTIDQAVARLFSELSFQEQPAGLYDPLRYTVALGGKRLRPRLCLLAYSFFKDEFTPGILGPAAGLEVYHSFTLIHDDVMDRSPLRRGSETVWKKWSETTAILSGDVMCIDAFKRIAQAPVEVLPEALSLFSRTAAEVCDGQQLDMDFEGREMVGMDEYMQMIGLKTGVLLACSAAMGALIGGASQAECDALYQYGYELGMAFQVADDYLDAFGDEKVFGKPIGGDIVNGKKSWLTVRTLEKTPDKAGFLAAFALPADTPEQKAAKIAAVKEIYLQNGVDADAKAEIVRFTERAMQAVSGVGFSPLKLETLHRFAERLVGRAK